MQLYAVWVALAVAALLAAEWRGSRAGVWLAKPLAAAGFLAAALAAGALDSTYGRFVLAALLLSALGDVLLISRGTRSAFLSGLLSFALAHVVYAGAFVLRGLEPLGFAAGTVAAVGLGTAAALWLGARVPAALRLPVRGYLCVIGLMLACAAGASAHGGRPELLGGAALFAVSDLAVARERFVAPAFLNKLWGLPLYFAAQLLLAASCMAARAG